MSDRRVLLVDDQPHVLRVIKMALERGGYSVDTSANGGEAMERLRAQPYDVVITDLNMPRVDGQALCEMMRTEITGPRPLTLVVTGRTDDELREWAAALDNTEFLEKPVSLRRLTSRLASHFASRS